MRDRERILASLESVYREAFEGARERGDAARMSELDFAYQQEQLRIEVLLDIRDLLRGGEASEPDSPSLIERAESLRRITRLR